MGKVVRIPAGNTTNVHYNFVVAKPLVFNNLHFRGKKKEVHFFEQPIYFVVAGDDEVDMEDDNVVEQICKDKYVIDGVELDLEPKVVIEAVVDTWLEGDGNKRLLEDDEKEVLELLRKVKNDEEWKEVPNMRAVERKKLMKEVELLEGVMHNLLWQGMEVTEVNRLLYAGGVVVAMRLGLKVGTVKKGKMMKPRWQRRIEKSIEMWRGHLSQVEEIRKGKKVGEKVWQELDRKYGLTERGALSVSTFLKNKIQSGSRKIRRLVGKCVIYQQSNLFKRYQIQLQHGLLHI